jgi:hypothetical protein
MIRWTPEQVAFLRDNYPKLGRDQCALVMGLTSGQVRMKASRLGLEARGVSDAWKQKQKDHSEILTGRKRPDQALVMKSLHKQGKLKKTEEQRRAISVRVKKHIAENGHPRGALGMVHTEETRKKLSIKSSETWASWSDEKKHEFAVKVTKSRLANGNYVQERPNASWKAAWHEIGGTRKYYRSRWEANYAYYLQWLKERGEILDWKHEPKVFWFEGVKRGTVSYLPDFCVTEKDGSEAYHEVKGWMDDRSKTKIRRMAKYHPDVKLIVIDKKAYEALRKTVSKIVLGWN